MPIDAAAAAVANYVAAWDAPNEDGRRTALERAWEDDGVAQPGPALVQLVTDPNALPMPPRIKPEQVKGFAAGKVVLNGGVGRMLEMAWANARTIPGALSTGLR